VRAPRYLLDSTVLIHLLRDRAEAVEFVHGLRERSFLSTLVVGEVFSGIREGRERLAMERWMSFSRIVPVTTDLAREGGLIARQYRRSHGTGLADGILAATAVYLGATLVTSNVRHFPMLPDVHKPY
jgi:predicted nucleic acid-binding protein